MEKPREKEKNPRLGKRWAAGAEALWGLLFPEVCEVCGRERATAREGYLCASCTAAPGHVRHAEPPWCERCGLPFAGAFTHSFHCDNCRDLDLQFDHARAALIATPFLLDLIHRFKYGGRQWIGTRLGQWLVEAFGRHAAPEEWQGIVAVPLHPLRQRERDFNQSERLAQALGEALGLRVSVGLVRRVRATRTQALLARSERSKNVAGAFAVRPGARCEGRWLVVDDVLTTGVTTSEVAAALREAGADVVDVWTLARGVRH